MSDYLIALGIVVLLGVGFVAYARRGGGRDERRRARAIAEATSGRHEPLSADEQEHAEEIHAIVVEHRTGELPKVVDVRRPSVQGIARRYRRPGQHAARKLPKKQSKGFDPLSSPMPVTEQAVMLPGPQPAPWRAETFTGSWTRADVQRMVNGAKAAGK